MNDIHLKVQGDLLQKQINIYFGHGLDNADTINALDLFVQRLARDGYHFLSQEEVWRYYEGDMSIPAKAVQLQFDDGGGSTLVQGTPILQKYGARATLCYEWNKLDAWNYTWYATSQQLRDAVASDVWDLGTHGFIGHAADPPGGAPYPPGFNGGWTGDPFGTRPTWTATGIPWTDAEIEAFIRSDVQAAKQRAAWFTSKPIRCFAYPGGAYPSDLAVRAIHDQIYDEEEVIGFRVTDGCKIYPANIARGNINRHGGKRGASQDLNYYQDINSIGLPDTTFNALVRVGNKYLGITQNATFGEPPVFQYYSLDMSKDGDPFSIAGINYYVRGAFYDTERNLLWLAGILGYCSINLTTRTIVNQANDIWCGELGGIAAAGDYVYAYSHQNGHLYRGSRTNPPGGGGWTDLGHLKDGGQELPAWDAQSSATIIGGYWYQPSASRRSIGVYDMTTLNLVRRIHLPRSLWIENANNVTAVVCPDGDPEEWLLCSWGRMVKYRAA